MSKKRGEYRGVFKATAILGSVQLFNILIAVVRNKCISILLGPAGMGIMGLLTSATGTITGFTNLGITFSAIKNIASAYEKGDYTTLGKVLYVLQRCIWTTGLLGAIVCLSLCRQLSQWTFGNTDFTISFAFLSISLLLTQLTNGNLLILKGCRNINYYAKANVWGNFLSLFITVPLYFWLGIDAIVPALILFSISTFLCAYFYRSRLRLVQIRTERGEFKEISKDILIAGIAFSAAEFFPLIASFYIRTFISNNGGLTDVGLFSAGFAILNGYVGMIFTAMSTDYIPRLSAVSDDDHQLELVINQQIEMSILLLFPLIVLFVIFGKLMILILYSSQFYPMIEMIYWGGLGMLFKVPNWCFGCILIPKRESKAYFYFSILSALFYLGMNMLLYSVWGIKGLGISFLLSHIFDASVSYWYINRKYQINYKVRTILELLGMGVVIVTVIIFHSFQLVTWIIYTLDFCVCILVGLYSYNRLNSLMDLTSFIKSILNGRKK